MTFNLFYAQNSNNHLSKAFGERKCVCTFREVYQNEFGTVLFLNALFFSSSKFIQNISLSTFKSQVNNYEV